MSRYRKILYYKRKTDAFQSALLSKSLTIQYDISAYISKSLTIIYDLARTDARSLWEKKEPDRALWETLPLSNPTFRQVPLEDSSSILVTEDGIPIATGDGYIITL